MPERDANQRRGGHPDPVGPTNPVAPPKPGAERDANQLAADVRNDIEHFYAGNHSDTRRHRRDRSFAALDELVGLVGTLQQERDDAREQVKFCPYCGGAFVPERGYEGPCAGCAKHQAAEAALAEAMQHIKTLLPRLATTRQALTALLDDTLALMDRHASHEVQLEARRRIIERHGADTGGEPA